jgi:hypothetical protein
MQYEAPVVVDFGSIADHTFANVPSGRGRKDFRVCATDKFGDFSCGGDHGLS